MSKIYLLTGAAGLLGSNIARQLVDAKEVVRALVLKDDPAVAYVPDQVQIIYGDLLDINSMEELFTVPEGSEVIVIHCASIVTMNPNPNPKVYAVNVDGTRNIIDMCLKNKVKKLVYVSSTGAIPELPHGQKIKEVDHFLPADGLVGYYSVTKAQASQLVLDALRWCPGLDASIVHPSGICGPNDYAFGPVAQTVSQYLNGEVKIGLDGTFNSVDVRDLAAGVIACCDKGRRGECYIMSNELVTMKELYDIINRTANMNVHANILSKGIASLAVKFIKMQSKFTGEEPVLTDFAVYNMTRNNDFDCSKAKQELGFSCRPFEETIRDEVNWLLEEAKAAGGQTEEAEKNAEKTVEEIKERIKMGDISKVIVRKGDERLLSIPLNISVAASVVGVTVAPLTFLPAMISAIGLDCHIELEKKDGTVMDVTNGVASAIVDAAGYSDRN